VTTLEGLGERAQPQDLVRSFDAMSMDVKPDGLVEALIVPWDRWADVTEPHPTGPGIVSYREAFARGSLDGAMRVPRRIGLAFTHSDAFTDRLGYGVDLRDSREGAVATFELYPSIRDRALDVLRSSHRGMSMTFRSLAPSFQTPDRSGIDVLRSRAHLRYVAATDCPVYEDAQVLAMRDQAQALAEQQEEHNRRAAKYAQGLELLRSNGMDLTPKQAEFLQAHRQLLDV
jgi:phage head maturation protease